jgi:outer membrane receptor protein involved in Fe transport
VGAKQDWLLSLSEKWVLKWGADVSNGNAGYDYSNRIGRERVLNGSVVTTYDSTSTMLSPSGSTAGLYLAQRVRPWSPLTIETGLRWDRQSHTGESEWLPRVNAVLAIDRNTTLRAAWGRYAQPHALFQLGVQDGLTAFEQAERAVQYVAGIERNLGAGLSGRVEVYRRDESELRTRYRNLDNTIEPVSEVETDRRECTSTRHRAAAAAPRRALQLVGQLRLRARL